MGIVFLPEICLHGNQIPRRNPPTLTELSPVTISPHLPPPVLVSPQKTAHRNISKCSFVILFRTASEQLKCKHFFFPSSCSCARRRRNSVFTVEQVTFLADIFSVVQLDKVKVKAPGNFVWGILFTFSLWIEITKDMCSHCHLFIFFKKIFKIHPCL